MTSLAHFFRSTPAAVLRNYFESRGIATPETIDWSASTNEIARALVDVSEQMPDETRARLLSDAERITGMADESGQTALYSVTNDREALDALGNGYARSIVMFLNDQCAFRHAEEVRYADEHRRGRMWEGFSSEPNLSVQRSGDTLDQFKSAAREHFDSPNVHVDIFDRNRPRFEKPHTSLIQATIYSDGRPDEVLEFVDGALDRRPRRPVYEAAITYEPATGVIEVVGDGREGRAELARLYSRHLLGSKSRQTPLKLRRYDLGVLLQPHGFPTDPADGIENVEVNELRLASVDTAGVGIVLEFKQKAPQTIWRMSRERFGFSDPLNGGGWVVRRAKLTITFHPSEGARRGRRLPLTVRIPHGCNLKDCTERERMIGEKYLTRWHLVKDV